MKPTLKNPVLNKTLIAASVAAVLLAACASTPRAEPGAAEARAKLTRLQSDPNLATKAPVALKQAEVAVTAAELPQHDPQLAAHRIYLADRKVDTARALAEAQFAVDQRVVLSQERDSSRLAARTREADAAKHDAQLAQAEGARQKASADQARTDTLAANQAADAADAQSADLQRQIEDMQARVTDHGLVLTLGDVEFASGKAELRDGASGNLGKLVAFLNKYPDRNVQIVGHTDSAGGEDYNQGLSERRAESVRTYLTGHGIGSGRLTASGKGKGQPIADNTSASGRQQNRRVEVTIENPATAAR
jgi:outer membrane protein OmpA-like peptidoglycan-associated protein